MADYRPLDISEWCNAGPSLVEAESAEIAGERVFRGLPFLVGGDDAQRCFISLSASDSPVTVPIDEPARRVLVAHRLIDSEAASGGPLGVQVAEYVFRLSGGREVRVPIRERFEIGTMGGGFAVSGTGLPFLAVPDEKARLLPRYEGPWDEAGRRQTEAQPGVARHYYLWTWASPEPDRSIESMEIVPSGPRFIVAAITLGYLDEHPFARQGRLAARITLTDEADADKDFSGLDVEVDRGDTTYVFPLPRSSAQEHVEADYAWGRPLNRTSSPSYVEMSAVPSATVTVTQDGKSVGSVNWGQVLETGGAATPSE